MRSSHSFSSKLSRKQRGQGMTEYIIIVALIAVAAIGTYSMFGQTIRNQVAGLADEVSGTGGANDITNAQSSSSKAQGDSKTSKGMGNYNADNAPSGGSGSGSGGGAPASGG